MVLASKQQASKRASERAVSFSSYGRCGGGREGVARWTIIHRAGAARESWVVEYSNVLKSVGVARRRCRLSLQLLQQQEQQDTSAWGVSQFSSFSQ